MDKTKETIIDYKEYMAPIWQGNVAYDESVMVMTQQNGEVLPITLLYYIDTVVSVKSSDLQTEFRLNDDYSVEDGRLIINLNGNIPIIAYDEYYLKEEMPGASFPRNGGGHLRFAEGEYFHNKKIVITYTHSDVWQFAVPECKLQDLPNTYKALDKKQPLKILFYGDSITVGANSSSTFLASPNLPTYPELTTSELKRRYAYQDIDMVNNSKGGEDSLWGKQNAKKLAADVGADLIFIAFGMNDTNRTPADFRNNIKSIIDIIRETNNSCEIVLVATMLANKEAQGFFGKQENFFEELVALQKQYNGVAVANMTAMHQALLHRKEYRDMTGNNINHPNDYLVRVYAQVMIKTLSLCEI